MIFHHFSWRHINENLIRNFLLLVYSSKCQQFLPVSTHRLKITDHSRQPFFFPSLWMETLSFTAGFSKPFLNKSANFISSKMQIHNCTCYFFWANKPVSSRRFFRFHNEWRGWVERKTYNTAGTSTDKVEGKAMISQTLSTRPIVVFMIRKDSG